MAQKQLRPAGGAGEALTEFDRAGQRIDPEYTPPKSLPQAPYVAIYRVTPTLFVEVARHG